MVNATLLVNRLLTTTQITLNGPARQIYVGRSFTQVNGVTYAKQWFTALSAAEKTGA